MLFVFLLLGGVVERPQLRHQADRVVGAVGGEGLRDDEERLRELVDRELLAAALQQRSTREEFGDRKQRTA